MASGNSAWEQAFKQHAWVIELTERGEFDDQQAARTVFDFYCQSTWANDGEDHKRGDVMSGCIRASVVARKTGLTERSVRRANDWLHEQGFIYIVDDPDASKYRRILGVIVMTRDEQSERQRKLRAGTFTRHAIDTRAKHRHLHVVREIGHGVR